MFNILWHPLLVIFAFGTTVLLAGLASSRTFMVFLDNRLRPAGSFRDFERKIQDLMPLVAVPFIAIWLIGFFIGVGKSGWEFALPTLFGMGIVSLPVVGVLLWRHRRIHIESLKRLLA